MPKKRPTIVAVHSEDKFGLDPKPPSDHPMSMSRGSRICLLAPPGHGKTSIAKQIAIHSSTAKDPFRAVVIISGVGEHTKEWDKVPTHIKTDFSTADENWWAALSKQLPQHLTGINRAAGVDVGDEVQHRSVVWKQHLMGAARRHHRVDVAHVEPLEI